MIAIIIAKISQLLLLTDLANITLSS